MARPPGPRLTAGCLPGVRLPGVCPARSQSRETLSDPQTMLRARRLFPAPAPARRKAPARETPYLGRDKAPPQGGEPQPSPQAATGLGAGWGFWAVGTLFVPITELRTPAAGAEQGDMEHVQCLTPQEGKCLTQTETQTKQT